MFVTNGKISFLFPRLNNIFIYIYIILYNEIIHIIIYYIYISQFLHPFINGHKNKNIKNRHLKNKFKSSDPVKVIPCQFKQVKSFPL